MLPASEGDILKKICQIWKSPENKNKMIKGKYVVTFTEDVIGSDRNVLWGNPGYPLPF